MNTYIQPQQSRHAATVFTLDANSLSALGLGDTDIEQIKTVAHTIKLDDLASVANFGREVAAHTSSYADPLLDQITNKDLDSAGEKLSQVVTLARSVNINGLTQKRSRLPIIGGLINRIKLRGGNALARFDTTREQIEKLIAEVQTAQGNIAERNASLNSMFAAVENEHHLLGVHVAAGHLRLNEMRAQAEDMRQSVNNDPTQLQRLADLDAQIANLDKRIDDLRAMQHSAYQSLPAIRIIQANNQMLIDKFHTIREITVPAWKRQFMLAVSLNEQRNAVELAQSIDDTTNALLRSNAELLHRNAVDTAKANQRLAIDPETLQKVQDELIRTVQDVQAIIRKGAGERRNAQKQIEQMRTSLRTELVGSKTEGAA